MRRQQARWSVVAGIAVMLAIVTVGLWALKDCVVRSDQASGPTRRAADETRASESSFPKSEQQGTIPLNFSANLSKIAELGDAPVDERQDRLGLELVRHGAASVAEFYGPDAPEVLRKRIPSILTDTPAVPGSPSTWGDARRRQWQADGWRAEVRGGHVSAALFGWFGRAGPVELVMAEADQEQSFRLAEELSLIHESRPLLCGANRLLVFMLASGPPYRQTPQVERSPTYYVRIYQSEAPDWRPRLLHDASGMWAWGTVVGRTVEGSAVWILYKVEPHSTTGQPAADGGEKGPSPADPAQVLPHDVLIEVDTDAATCKQAATGQQLPTRFLPSPDGRFLAAGPDVRSVHEGGPNEGLLELIDLHDGMVTSLNQRSIHGCYIWSAVAWSADVPGRLFFTDENDTLWRVDLPIEGRLQDEVD